MENGFWAQIKGTKRVGQDTYEVDFSCVDHTLIFSPGQYVWVVLSELAFPDSKGERRAFSIASSSADTSSFSILFRASDSGYKKTLISMPEGTKVRIIGPHGSSYVPTSDQKKIVMIAGGMGIAPFLSIVRSIEDNENGRFSLVYVHSVLDQGSYLDDISQIARQKNINFLSHSGPFDSALIPPNSDWANDYFFICGPAGMVNAVYNDLIARGVPFEHMRFEQHYPTPMGNLTENDFIEKEGEKNIMLQAVSESKNHIIVTDANGQIIYANRSAETNTGYTFDEMRGNTPRLWGGLMPPEFYSDLWNKKKEKGGFDGQIINRRKNGELYYVIAHISPISNDEGVVIGYIGTEEDITPTILLERQLSSGKTIDDALLHSIGEGVVFEDKEGKVSFINETALAMFQYSADELLGKPFVEVVKAETSEGHKIETPDRPVMQAAQTKKLVKSQLVYIRKDQTKFDAEVIVTPVYVGKEFYGIVQVFKDITKERQIDRAKTEFISLASHQLRTPLSTINWYCEMLLAGDVGQLTEEQKKYINEAYTGSKRMTKLVGALLNASRIETGSYMVEPENVDVVKVVRDVLDENKPQTDEKNLKVTLSKEEIPTMMVDPNLMIIIFQNLITNSVKYTPAGGEIKIGLRILTKGAQIENVPVEVDCLLITVADTGLGIPESQRNQIFQKLFRADNVRKSNTDGTGLGLYLVKSLIEHSQGKIWFNSVEDKGTTFFVMLPLAGMTKKEGTKKLDIERG